jgi:hypothetical protein
MTISRQKHTNIGYNDSISEVFSLQPWQDSTPDILFLGGCSSGLLSLNHFCQELSQSKKFIWEIFTPSMNTIVSFTSSLTTRIVEFFKRIVSSF